MLRSVSVQLRRHLRQPLKATANHSSRGRCLSSVIVANNYSAPQKCLPPTGIAHGASQYRTFFTTTHTCADLKEFPCPGLPESIADGGIKYLKKVGDSVALDETVCEIETQKTALPVRSDVAGVLVKWLVEDGATVTPGTALFAIAVGEAASAAPAQAAPAAKSPSAPPTPAAPVKQPTPQAATAPKPAEPVSTQFPPSKPMSVTAAPKAAPPPAPVSTRAAAPPVDGTLKPDVPTRTENRVRMSRMRQTIAGRLKDAQNTYAMLTTFNEVDMSAIFDMRKRYQDAFAKKHGIKLGFMSPFIVGAAAALKEMPVINAVIDGNEVVYRDYVDLGVAVATPRGLVVPVLRNADKFSLVDAERALSEMGEKARKDAITLEDMDGGTFTISNGGVFGSMFGTPIINPPQSAILGMHAIVERPVVIRDHGAPASAPPRIEARPVMYLALTYDHRLIDGREAVTFLRKIKAVIEDPRLLLLSLSI